MLDRIRFLCPICHETIEIIPVKAKPGELKSVAIAHKDHVVVVDFDQNGAVRSINTVKVSKIEGKSNIKCPRCGKSLAIPENVSGVYQAAYVHEGHIAVLFLVHGQYYTVEVIEKAREVKRVKEKNFFHEIEEHISLDALADVLSRLFVWGDKIVYVPKEVIEPLRNLISKIPDSEKIEILTGPIKIENAPGKDYFLQEIKKLYDMPNDEIMYRFKSRVETLYKLADLLAALVRLNISKSDLKVFLDELKNTNRYDIVIEIVKRKYPKLILPIIED
ncbi:MAG: hypothetical protein ACTSU6_02300 [Candidatus Njordarchaeales archaeon]